MGKPAGLGDYTVIQYLFIYCPCRVWGLGDGVSHPHLSALCPGWSKDPQFWFFPVETPIPKHCWAQRSPECPGPVHLHMDVPLFSPKPLLGGDQTDRSQKHKGSHSSLCRAAPWLHRAGFSMVRHLPRGMCGVRKRMLVQGPQLQLFWVLFLPRKYIHTYLRRLYKTSIITQEPVWEFFSH